MQYERTLEVESDDGVKLQVGLSGLQTQSSISLFFIHGMGSSAATWHNQIFQLSQYFQLIFPDLRGHGSSDDCESLDINFLVGDVIKMIHYLKDTIGNRKVILIGHSVGGVIATFVAHSSVAVIEGMIGGVVCLDMAEGTALNSLQNMKATLESWPKEFPSIESCIDWSVRHHHPTKICSAEKSIPPLLRRISPGGAFVLKPCLLSFENNWRSWFINFNSSFLELSAKKIPHLLLLSSMNRLDDELTIAHMQGKFQLKVIQGGLGEHFLHEDQPEQTLAILAQFFHSSSFISQSTMSTIMTHSMFTTFPSHDFQTPHL